MSEKNKEIKNGKRAYEKPQIEITVFQTENICYESDVLGDTFGMDGIDIF